MLNWIDLTDVTTNVLGLIIGTGILGIIGFLWSLLNNSKRKVKKVVVPANPSQTPNGSAVYFIKIEVYSSKIHTNTLINLLNKEINGNVYLVNGSEIYEEDFLIFKLQVSPRSTIDYKGIFDILSANEKGKYNVHTVHNIA